MTRSADSVRRTGRGPIAGSWRALKAVARGIFFVLTAPSRPFRRSRRDPSPRQPVRIQPVPSYGVAERPSARPDRAPTPEPRPPEPDEPPSRRRRSRWALVADWTGRALITLGMLTLLFVAYQLWGTNLVQAQEQRDLKSTLRDRLEAVDERPATTTTTAAAGERPAPSTTTTTLPPPQLGEPIGLLEIPAIGVEQAFVEGTGRDELKKGPGHYPHSPLPGHQGNASLAGHRTTYGAPFMDLDQLKPGDEIVVSTVEGTFRYQVTGSLITDPGDVSVVDVTGDNRLTLTTCHPKYSARERLIVVAHLQGDPVDAEPEAPEAGDGEPIELPGEDVVGDEPGGPPAGGDTPDGGESPAGGESAAAGVPATLDAGEASGLDAVDRGTGLWTLALLAAGAAWWAVFRRRARWYTWVGGVLPFLAVLFFFFGEVESLLPANY